MMHSVIVDGSPGVFTRLSASVTRGVCTLL